MTKKEETKRVPTTMVEEEVNEGMFFQSLTRNNSQIRRDRAAMISEDAHLKYKRTIEDMEMDLRNLKRDREAMLDMSPDNAMNLKVASDFDGTAFVTKDIEIGLKMRNIRIRLEIATERYNELFVGK